MIILVGGVEINHIGQYNAIHSNQRQLARRRIAALGDKPRNHYESTRVNGFFIVMATLALVPSASVALVVARSSTSGFSSGCAAAAGIVAGDLAFVLLAILGMAALAEVMGSFFLILRYLAGAYLIWFGISLLKSKSSSPVNLSVRSASTLPVSFFSGLVLTLGDVKAIFFYASLFPAFVDLATIDVWDIAIIIVLTTIGTVAVMAWLKAVHLESWQSSSIRHRV